MYQVLIGLILALGFGGYWLYDENQTLKENNTKLEIAVEEQKVAMNAIKESYELQGKELSNLARKNAQIEADPLICLALGIASLLYCFVLPPTLQMHVGSSYRIRLLRLRL